MRRQRASGAPTFKAQSPPFGNVRLRLRGCAATLRNRRSQSMGRTKDMLEDWASETVIPVAGGAEAEGLRCASLGEPGIPFADHGGRITDGCRHIERIFACPRGELIGRPLTSLPPEIGAHENLISFTGQLGRLSGDAPEVVELNAARRDDSGFPTDLAH